MSEELIKLIGVSRIFKKDSNIIRVLDEVNLTIKRNEYIAIIGIPASGKSTLINILACVDKSTSGEYFFEGTDVFSMNEEQLFSIRNQKVGFIPRTFVLLPSYSVLDNVLLFLRYAGFPRHICVRKAKRELLKVGLYDVMNCKPEVLTVEQLKRAAIAQALVTNPLIILADEPTENLSSKSSEKIMSLLTKIHSEGKTVVFVTKNSNIAKYAHKIVEICNGKLKFEACYE